MALDPTNFGDALILALVTYGWLLPFAGAAAFCGYVLHTLGRK